MPLQDAIPDLDRRRYDDLMAEVRTRIPRYTPEWFPVWTDLNDSDPGITMVQVFAWLAEMLTYRMGQVPELNYLKFLQLLGIELRPREPATAEIEFPVKDTHGQPFVIIPTRTQVTAEAPEGGPPVVFETDRSLIALTARLRAVQQYDGYAYADLTQANAAGDQPYRPFGPLAGDDSAVLLGFDYAGAFPQAELNLSVTVASSGPGPSFVTCGLATSAPVYPSARLRWEYWGGAAGWQPLSLLRDDTAALTRSGHVYLRTPAPGLMTKTATVGVITDSLYWIRARVERGQYERPPQLLAVRTNTVAATQAQTVTDEVLGGSNGRRDQIFRLENAPVLSDSLELEVDQGDGFQPWTRVDDFFGSGPNDIHYLLDRTTGEIRFGDGVNGAIPVSNDQNPTASIVARVYRFGGGKRGNARAKAIKTLATSITGVDESAVANLFAAVGGREEESLDEAKKRAPRSIKSRCRAVTAEDFELLATQAANVKRAKAIPLMHPSFPDVKVPGVVSVIIVPDSDDARPMPSDGTLRTVCAYLDHRRLLTTELYVLRPTYQRVDVQVDVVATDDADLAEIKQTIEARLETYFHALRGGEAGQGWPFGGKIFYSRVHQQVLTVPGVASVARLIISLDGVEALACTDVAIREMGLLYSGQHEVQVEYSFET